MISVKRVDGLRQDGVSKYMYTLPFRSLSLVVRDQGIWQESPGRHFSRRFFFLFGRYRSLITQSCWLGEPYFSLSFCQRISCFFLVSLLLL